MRVVAVDERAAPVLGLVQGQRVLGAPELQRGDGFAQRLDVGTPHQLADVLHLAAARFVRSRAPELVDRIAQRVGHLEAARRSSGISTSAAPRSLQLVRGLLQLVLLGRSAAVSSASGATSSAEERGALIAFAAGYNGVLGMIAAPSCHRPHP
jgi:hypothetical protein